MIVVTLTDCPISLRGDLTKWLIEINAGVFVGKVSARVRDNLWKRITENVKNGRATMVFSTNNEQRMDFRVHKCGWIPIDFDGLKLVLHPSFSRTKKLTDSRMGFSKASKYRMAQRSKNKFLVESENKTQENTYPSDYVILDIETSGLDAQKDEIIEIGALQVKQDHVVATFHVLIKPNIPISSTIINLTGITNEILEKDSVSITEALSETKKFLGEATICGYNIGFDIGFLNVAFRKINLSDINNKCIDTMEIYTQVRKGRKVSKRLKDVAKYCKVEMLESHRSMSDCRTVKEIYDVLIRKLGSD